MLNIWYIMKITFKEGIRSKILFGISLLAVLLFASNVAITNLFSFELGKVMVDVCFSSLSLAGLSVIFFLAIGLLSRDIHDKTIYMIISRPITRAQYIWGKFGGLALILLVTFLILGILSIVSFYACCGLVSGTHLPRNFSWSNAVVTIFFNFLSILLVLSIAFFFTVISSSIYLAMLFTFCTYIIGNSLETIVKILERGEFIKASGSFTSIMKGISWTLPNLAAFDLKANLAYGLPTDPVCLFWTAVYGCTYTVILIMLTTIIFMRKDIC